MKKNLFLVATFFCASIFLTSCTKEELPTNSANKVETSTIKPQAKKYIYYATWSEWGRTSKNCAGWGLCEFSDCWFCEGSKYSGQVIFDSETKQGHLIIKLDPSEQIQNTAIQQQSPFFIDEDINNTNSILHKGEYLFDSKIGTYGGYKLNITIK